MEKIIKIWDGKKSINGVLAEDVLKDREDLRNNLGDIFLVEDIYGIVLEIQIGKTIKSIYKLDPNLSLEETANEYLELMKIQEVNEQIALANSIESDERLIRIEEKLDLICKKLNL